MRLIKAKDYQEVSRQVANIISAQVILRPDSVLGLGTGSSPIGAYRQLIEWYNKGDIDFSEVTTVNLDEYRGLPKEHPESYWSFMHRNLFDHVNIRPEAINLPDGTNMDADAECARYDAVIHNVGGVDLQLLGIGNNGHIAFNEAADVLHATAHIEQLTESTINANARFFEKKEDVPTTAITMGMGDILAAKCVVLIATGLAKTSAIKGLIMDDVITTQNPSSMLKMHENVVVVIDEELAAAVGYKA